MLKTHFDNYQPSVLNQPLLIGGNLLPRFWSVVWTEIAMGSLSDNTKIAKLRCIEDFYKFVDSMHGDGSLDDALGFADFKFLSEMLESYFISLRNKSNRTFSDEVRWNTVRTFVTNSVGFMTCHDTIVFALCF